MTLAQLHALIAAACPITGIDSNGTIHFDVSATPAQRTQAQQIMAANIGSLKV